MVLNIKKKTTTYEDQKTKEIKPLDDYETTLLELPFQNILR